MYPQYFKEIIYLLWLAVNFYRNAKPEPDERAGGSCDCRRPFSCAVCCAVFVLAPGVLGSFPGVRLFPRAGEERERKLCVSESDFFGVSRRVLRPLPSSPVCAAVDLEHRIFAPLLPRRGTDEIGRSHHSRQPAELPCGRPCTPGPHVIPSSQNWCSNFKFIFHPSFFHDGRRLFMQCHFSDPFSVTF